MKTANYVTTKEHSYFNEFFEQKTIPVNTFVKPISIQYLPQHIKDSKMFNWFNAENDMFVYCYYGIIIIPKDLIKEI